MNRLIEEGHINDARKTAVKLFAEEANDYLVEIDSLGWFHL